MTRSATPIERLLETGLVMRVSKTSDEIPEHERFRIFRGFAGNFGNIGLACTILRLDGVVLVITDGKVDEGVLRHEFIHVAQCFASDEIMNAALEAAAQVGAVLAAEIVRLSTGDPDLEHAHRDFFRSRELWIRKAGPNPLVEDFPTFQFYQDLYPTKATAELAARVLGLDHPHGTYAALTAHLLKEAGKDIDPKSDFARELVAYTFERMHSTVIDDLMEEAADVAEAKAEQLSVLPSSNW